MAREKDGNKRRAIMAEAKRLFADKGFDGTSVPDIVRGLGLPVGSVYTYFANKDDLARAVIEEGWAGFFEDMEAACASEPSAVARLYLVVERFLPALFGDVDLISIFLSDGLRLTNLADKLEALGLFVSGLVSEAAAESGLVLAISPSQLKTALSVFFLGSLDTIRLARRAGLPLSEADVIAFIRASVDNGFARPGDGRGLAGREPAD